MSDSEEGYGANLDKLMQRRDMVEILRLQLRDGSRFYFEVA